MSEDGLANYLSGAFLTLESIFSKLDLDGTGKISFPQLARTFATWGFRDDEALHRLFNRVDKDGGGTLDFAEFIVLMYLWAEVGNYQAIVRPQAAADGVKAAFEVMERCYVGYDSDKRRQLTHDEFEAFMTQQLPIAHADSHAVQLVTNIFPSNVPYISFSRFLYLLYKIVVRNGKYNIHGETQSGRQLPPTASATGAGQGSHLWHILSYCFTHLEHDFRLFDVEDNHCIDLAHLTQGVTHLRPSNARLDILSRLEYYFRLVDVDRSETIDFFEFMYLAFLITQNGSYRDLVDNSTNPAAVKDAFTTLRQVYRKYDADNSNRLELEELKAFMTGEFHYIPPETETVFRRLMSSPDRPHIDFVRFMRLLYEIVLPTGRYVESQPQKPSAPPVRHQILASHHTPPSGPRPPRFDHIDVSQVVKGAVLGQGGQGVAYRAEYQGVKCAAKFLLEGATPETCAETQNECALMYRMDHPNVHFLHGFIAQMPNVCILTELCDNGSIFDCYMKRRMRFDRPTEWRFAHECALGIRVLHHMNPPFMHRDIKSLNVFLTSDLVCKVADFGMAKDPKVGRNEQGMGTPQWCAPEVLSSTHYDERADVFSYGILLWELTHLQIPYMDTNMDQAQIARAVTTQDIRPKIDPNLLPQMAALIRACWERDPAKRPTMDQVVQELEVLRPSFH